MGTGVSVGGIGVSDGMGVAVGGFGVSDGTGVLVGGTGVLEETVVLVGIGGSVFNTTTPPLLFDLAGLVGKGPLIIKASTSSIVVPDFWNVSFR